MIALLKRLLHQYNITAVIDVGANVGQNLLKLFVSFNKKESIVHLLGFLAN